MHILKSGKSKLAFGVFAVACLGTIVLICNVLAVQRVAWNVKDADYRNQGITILAYYRYGIIPNEIVFDLWGVDSSKSPTDVSRALIMFASEVKDRKFDNVYLAWRGDVRFVMRGDYFSTLGDAYGWQNPIYIVRTMPENLYYPDGSRAFGIWTGGLLGVVGEQFEDMNDFHKEWYINSLLAR